MGKPNQVVGMILAATFVAACAPQLSGPRDGATVEQQIRPSVLRVALDRPIPQFSVRLGPYTPVFHQLVDGFLAKTDERGVVHPFLLERLPSQDDGTWVVNADGTMRTILKLRPGLRWQDGQPLTSRDLVFAHRVYRDPDLPNNFLDPERFITSVVPQDDGTAELNWREPYSRAGSPEHKDLVPLPAHLLEDLYNRDKQAFLNSSFWTGPEYVGAGAFRVSEHEHGVQVTLTANPFFFLGRPNIDTIRIEVVSDENAIIARLLSGSIDFSESISPAQATLLREQWKNSGAGALYVALYKVRTLAPQQRDVLNHQAALRDVRVRRALMHAIDREALVDAGTAGLSMPADSYYAKDDRLYPRIEQTIAKYPYDVRRTEALLAEAGWVRGADGMFRNSAGQPFELEVTANASRFRDAEPIADYLKRAGMDAKPILMTDAQTKDPEFAASFPGVSIEGGEGGNYGNLTSAEVPTPENRWRGRNVTSYVNPEFDGLISRLLTTLNGAEQDDLTVAIERLRTTDVARGALYYDVSPAAALGYVKGIKGRSASGFFPSYLFNSWEWTIE